MSRKNKKSKQRVLDLESNEGTVISNLAANEDNSTPMDRLNVLQEMFANRIDPDIIHDVFQACAGNGEQAFNSLLEICSSAPHLPNEDSLPSQQAFNTSDHTISEVPHIVSEPALNESTNSNTEYLTTNAIQDPKVQVLNLTPLNLKPQMSPLNAVMPFASLFSGRPKQTNFVNNCHKSSHSSKPKEFGLKDEIKQMIQRSDQKVLVIMRGLPGSGKTTLANNLVYGSDGIILSTDDYFINNGNYNYNPNRLPDAHDWNQKRAKRYVENGRTPIVIDNTNLEAWELKPYVSIGHSKGYNIYFIEPDTYWARNPKELSRRTVHNIPKNKIESMAQRFERLAVEDVVKSLSANNKFIQKSNSVEGVNKTKVSTNASKLLVLRYTSGPSTSGCNSGPEESSQMFVSAQIEDMTSNSQISSSPNSTEPSTPLTDTQIDMDLLLALNRKSADSEDCSSINASDGGSSCVSQESGWERDDEFTYAHNQQLSPTDSTPDCNVFDICVKESNFENNLNSDSDLKPQREHKPKGAVKPIDDIIEEEIEFDEHWNQPNNDLNIMPDSSANSTQQELNSAINSRRMFGLVGVPKPNWEFPPFPIEANNTALNLSEISLTFYSRQTQTERKDWALLELKQSNEDSNEGLDTESVENDEELVETVIDGKRNDSKVRLHKGTITIDIPDHMTRNQKLDTLRTKFPKAETNHLNEILDACHEDEVWAEKLLSELNDDHFDVGSLEQIEQLPIPIDPELAEIDSESNSNSTEDEEPLELLVNQRNKEEPEFTLRLDSILASQLQSHFGPLTEATAPDHLTIRLSHGVARLLHHSWKKSLKQLNENLTQTQSISHSFVNNIKIKETNSKSKPLAVCPPLCPKSELQEIMDLELAKELSRKEYSESLASDAANAFWPSKRQMAKELLATKLKRDQLYQRYPGVDTNFLESIFESNNCYLGKTIDVLDNSLGLNDDFSRETEALIAQERNQSRNGSPVSYSRSVSPVKTVRKTVDINETLKQMNELLEKRIKFHSQARQAIGRKMFAVASYYGDEAMKLQQRIERFGKEIVDSLLSNSTNSNELDLHGLHVPEVNAVLSEFLRRKCDELKRSVGKRKLNIDIITGYGRTKGVEGRLKPLVIQYLKQKNFSYEMVNMGVIRVTLTQ